MRRRGPLAAVGAVVLAALLAAVPAQAVQTTTLQFEGWFDAPANNGGNLNDVELLGDPGLNWTRYSGCCTVNGVPKVPNATGNVISTNEDLLGVPVQYIGANGGLVTQLNTDADTIPGPDFTGTTLTSGVDGGSIFVEANFTGATELAALWQIVKVVVKQGNLNGIFVATELFEPTDLVQRATISPEEFAKFVEATGATFGVGISHSNGVFGTPTTPTVPEPGTVALLGLGLVGAGIAARRVRK